MEKLIGWRGFQTWTKSSGQPGGISLITAHGGPGLPSDYLEPLLDLGGSGRFVVRYDQLGCGNSPGPQDDSLWIMDTFVEELDAVVQELGGERFVLFGHSWGGWLILEYVIRRSPAGLAGLVLASTCSSLPAFASTTRALKAQLPAEIQDALDRHEAAGTTDSEEYNEASMAYATTFLIRGDIPQILLDSVGRNNEHIYGIMQGPEWNVTGNIKDWDVTDQLADIRVPVLVTSGRFDEMTPELVRPMVERLPDVRWIVFESSAHMAFLEETESYLRAVSGFLDEIEHGADR